MANETSYPQRKSPRLQGYDYSQSGAYFVTICTHQRLHYFGTVIETSVHLSALGRIANQELARIRLHWQNVDIDWFVVMPNHVHAIIVISDAPDTQKPDTVGTDTQKPDMQKRVPTLGHVVGNYKSGVTRLAYQQGYLEAGQRLWQGRYHDHIIRNEATLNYIRKYMLTNPAQWSEDKFYSEADSTTGL